MHDALTLALPWWQLVVRAAIVYIGVLILIRLSGKRTVGELSVFDLVVIILLGSSLRTAMLGNDKSLLGGFIVVTTLLLINFLSAWMSTRSKTVDHLIQGTPALLARDGEVFDSVLRKHNVPASDFDTAVRKAGCQGSEQVELAILEPNGAITIRKTKSH